MLGLQASACIMSAALQEIQQRKITTAVRNHTRPYCLPSSIQYTKRVCQQCSLLAAEHTQHSTKIRRMFKFQDPQCARHLLLHMHPCNSARRISGHRKVTTATSSTSIKTTSGREKLSPAVYLVKYRKMDNRLRSKYGFLRHSGYTREEETAAALKTTTQAPTGGPTDEHDTSLFYSAQVAGAK